jgi:hypothetical protein
MAPQDDAINFRYIIAAIRSNLTLIAFVMLITIAGAVAVTLLQAPRYKASASIQINNATNRVLKNQDDDQSDETMGGPRTPIASSDAGGRVAEPRHGRTRDAAHGADQQSALLRFPAHENARAQRDRSAKARIDHQASVEESRSFVAARFVSPPSPSPRPIRR